MSESLREHDFTDLYLGEGYQDMAVAPGSHSERVAVPEGLRDDASRLRAMCHEQWLRDQSDTFAIRHDDVLYRVNVIFDGREQAVFILRRVKAQVMEFGRLGLPQGIRRLLLEASTRGLVLFAGDQRSGKTTSAASTVSERLKTLGGMALAIEDPTETELEGLHGAGRCIQSPASGQRGGYVEQLRRAMRTGVGTILIGEIRCKDSAMESIRAAINGTTVLSTVHSTSVADAVARTVALASMEAGSSVREIMAMGLAAIVHQTMERVPTGGIRMQFRTLAVAGEHEASIRSKIRDGRYAELAQEVQAQQAKAASGL